MLNMASAYYSDQLAEKLQLMIATGDLRINSWMRQEGISDNTYHYVMTFDFPTPNWNVRVEYYDESSKMDFNKMIQLLAEKLANRALQEVGKQMDAANKPVAPL